MITTDSVVYVVGVAVAGGLVAAVKHLFKIVMQNQKDIQAELDECQADRKELWREIADIKSRVSEREKGTASAKPA